MKGNNLSKKKIMELANIFTSQVVSIYEFEKICDEFFEILWNEDNEIIESDKIDIIDRIEKTLMCTKIINENLSFE